MIENLEFEILYLKADRRPEDPAQPVCDPSPTERSNKKKTAGRIPQVLDLGQSVFQTSPNSSPIDLNRNLKLCKPNCKPVIHPFPGKSRNMDGRLLTCDGRPHSPWIKFLSRKTVVGSAFLVRYAAHIAELIKNTSTIQTNPTNNKKPRFQRFEYGIGLFVLNVTLRDSSFQKILIPGNIQTAGDIRRQL
jgi:hypothetical protein